MSTKQSITRKCYLPLYLLFLSACGGSGESGENANINLSSDYYNGTVIDVGGTPVRAMDIDSVQLDGVELDVLRFVDGSSAEVEILVDSQQSMQGTLVKEAVLTDNLGSDVYATNGFIDVVYPESYDGTRLIRLNTSNNNAQVVVFHPEHDALEVIPSRLNDEGFIEFDAPSEQRQVIFGLVEGVL